jgi:hypothetical protein
MKVIVEGTKLFVVCPCGKIHGPVYTDDTILCGCGIDYMEIMTSATTVSARVSVPYVRQPLVATVPPARGLNPDE